MDLEIEALFPIPVLHVVLLGPRNDALKNIKEEVNIDDFLTKHHIRGSGQGGVYNGPTLKKLFNDKEKLKELREIIGPQRSIFVDHIENIAKVHSISNSKVIDIDEAKTVLENFENTWDILRD